MTFPYFLLSCKILLLSNVTGRYKYITKEESANVYYVALELSAPEAIDAATYKLNARNVHGESNANLKLNFDGDFMRPVYLRKTNVFFLFRNGHELQ